MPSHIIINGRGSGKVGISDEPQPENNAGLMRRPTRVNQIKFRSSLWSWRKLRETQGKLKETVQTKPRGGGGGKAMMRLRAEETQTKTNGQMAA